MLTAPRLIQDPARRQGYAIAVALVLLACALLRLWQLGTPSEMMFDEIYYAKDAKAIVDGRVGVHGQYRWAAGDEVSWPHPELGKYAIAAGILLFGDRSFGWRIPAVIAGVALLACVYPLGRRLGLSPPWALLALLFAAADPLGITQSRIATLDIFIAVWTVVCLLCVLKYVQDGWRPRWLFLAGLAGGMATATKWSGGLAIVAALLIIAVSWLLQRGAARRAAAETRDDAQDDEPDDAQAPTGLAPDGAIVTRRRIPLTPPFAEQRLAEAPTGPALRRIALVVAAFVAVPVVVYFLGYLQYFLAGHTWADFVELHRQAVYFSLNLHATHTYASIAPSWIIDYRPVWYYFEGQQTYHGVIAIGNPFLWWMATLSLLLALLLALLRRTYALLPAAAIVLVLYLPWFATTRTSFIYYMTPVAPFMAILVAAALCLFAGGVVPRKAWLWVAGAALATAVLWQPIGIGAAQVFWTLPRKGGDALGWLGLTVGLILAGAVVLLLLSSRLKRYRPYTTLVVAGMIIGIVVAFVPIVLGFGISPEHWQRIMWFGNWI
jgi:dolichyl-phosphate-mannose--protein O-mannosyl transferase